jgi:hypothetical protein
MPILLRAADAMPDAINLRDAEALIGHALRGAGQNSAEDAAEISAELLRVALAEGVGSPVGCRLLRLAQCAAHLASLLAGDGWSRPAEPVGGDVFAISAAWRRSFAPLLEAAAGRSRGP